MSYKTPKTPFDFAPFAMPEWPAPAFSNWAFAEREDKLEERTFSGIERAQRTIWDQAEKVIDDHMSFVSHRMHEDLKCAKALGQCRVPDEAFATLKSFYTQLADEYQNHTRKQFELLQNGMSETIATAEELCDTATETASELAKAAEEAAKETAKPKRRTAAKQPK